MGRSELSSGAIVAFTVLEVEAEDDWDSNTSGCVTICASGPPKPSRR